MTVRELVEQIRTQQGWELSEEAGMALLTLPLQDGRRQSVRASDFKQDGHALVRFTSRVGAAESLTPQRYQTALEVNFRLPYGCLAIDGNELVLTETRPLETTTAETSARAIESIARQADKYEKFIFGTDQH